MIKLITNSDDFGLTNSVTDAIIDTHVNGIMTSTTMMANMEGFDYAAKMAGQYTDLGIGIHFNLTEGKPLTEISKIPDLVGEDGNFKPNSLQRRNLLFGKNKIEQIEIELRNQLEKLLDNKITPSHFDSHHHITGVPLAFDASTKVAKFYELNKARVTCIDFFYTSFYRESKLYKLVRNLRNTPKAFVHKNNKKKLRDQGFLTPDIKILPNRVLPILKDPVEQFVRTLSILKCGVTEISFHPGYENSNPNDSVKTANLRIRDLSVANSSFVMEYIKKNKIQLINFKDLKP